MKEFFISLLSLALALFYKVLAGDFSGATEAQE